MLLIGMVDIGIVLYLLVEWFELVVLLCYCWTYFIVVFEGYLLVVDGEVMFECLVCYLIIMYDIGLIGCWSIDVVFKCVGLWFDIVIIVMDVDIIKIYVELGLGVGIVVFIVFDEDCDCYLCVFDVCYFFEDNMMCLVVC